MLSKGTREQGILVHVLAFLPVPFWGHLMNGRNGDSDKRRSRCQRCLTGHPQAMQIIEKNAG